MPAIRNSFLIKRFTDFFKLKTNDFLDSEAGRMLVPVITEPIPVNIVEISDVVLNENDKIFTVPAGKQWKLLHAFASFTSDANAGNRRIILIIRNPADSSLWLARALNVQVASTTENYNFQRGIQEATEASATLHFVPLPLEVILPAGFDIRIRDENNIAAGDDMTVRMLVEEIDVTGE